MSIIIKASDLYYRYPKDTLNRSTPKFTGKPDNNPFNRDDLYDVLPLLAAVIENEGSEAPTVFALRDLITGAIEPEEWVSIVRRAA